MPGRRRNRWVAGLSLAAMMAMSLGVQAATVSVSRDLAEQGGDVVTAIVTLSDIADLGPVTVEVLDVTIRYDPSVLVFAGARPGAMLSGSVPAPLQAVNDTAERVTAAVVVISGVVLVEGGGGALFEADFRIRPGGRAGETTLDLESLAINESQVVFQLAGVDDSDGVVAIALSPAAVLVPILQLLLG